MRAYRFRQRFQKQIAEELGKGTVPIQLIGVLGWSPRDPRWILLYWERFPKFRRDA
jgi:hypothetical protein